MNHFLPKFAVSHTFQKGCCLGVGELCTGGFCFVTQDCHFYLESNPSEVGQIELILHCSVEELRFA